jgi:hypothetical protein
MGMCFILRISSSHNVVFLTKSQFHDREEKINPSNENLPLWTGLKVPTQPADVRSLLGKVYPG